jgi:hypothetical protein
MDGKKRLLGRRIERRFEGSRLEDQVWALAYEEIWPVLRKIVNHLRPAPQNKSHKRARGAATIARRA